MLPIVDINGHKFFCGCLPRVAGVGDLFPVFDEKVELIPESDWQEVNWAHKVPEIMNQDGIGACFPAGTLIRMGDGSQKPIEDVRVLDEVLTAEGRVRKVLKTMVRREGAGLVRLKTWGHRHLLATKEHPILTDKGYAPIGELKAGDMVAMPRFMPQAAAVVMPDEYLSQRVYTNRCKSVRCLQIPGKPAATIHRNRPPDAIQLDYDFGWLIGLYLAEGNSSMGKINWSLGLHEETTLAAKVVELADKVLGAQANIRRRTGSRAIVVTVYGTWWAQLFEAWCADGCANKRLHPDLASGPEGFLRGVLDGWVAGDGIGPGRKGGVTVSRQLAMNMFDIANALGLRPGVQWLDVAVNPKHKIKARRRRYIVQWTDSRDDDYRSTLTDTHVFRKVTATESEPFSGYVYNLEVEDDHSYVAEGIGVHNCNAFAATSALRVCRLMAGLSDVRISPGHLYGQINGGRDAGSLLGDALTALKDVGACTTDEVPELEWKRRNWPAGIEEVARKYRITEAWDCPTFAHLATAIQRGFVVDYGIAVGSNFDTDANGWVAEGKGRGGHAMCGVGLSKRTKNGKTQWGIVTANSWGTNWGVNGFGIVPASYFANELFTDGWAVRVAVDPSDEPWGPKNG